MSRDATETLHDYSPYAQLVAALLPRAAGLTIFDATGELRWTSEEAVPPQLRQVIAQSAPLAALNEEAGERVQLRSHEPVYLFWLRDRRGQPTTVLSVRWRMAESDPRTFTYVHAMLRPVIDCLKRELTLQARLEDDAPGQGAGATDADGDNDLKVLLSTDAPSAGGDVAQLLERINSHMRCDLTALLMPERNLVAVARAEGREFDTSILARAHRHLLSLAQLGKEALLLNEPGSLPGLNLPMRALVSGARNPAGRPGAVLVMFRSLEAPQFRRREGLLADLLLRRAAGLIEARYDALTGLFTRPAFESRVRAALAEREGNWCFLYLDADRLHAINDNHGMQVGDRLLEKLGELIRARLSPGAAAARITGDRFAILLPAGEEDATSFGEGLRAAIASLPAASVGAGPDVTLQSSLSVGVAPIPTGVDPMVALGAAETACRSAKRRGRNRVERFVPGGDSTVAVKIGSTITEAAATAVRSILEGDRLCLHAQLIAPLPGNVSPTPHFELLLRVQDENGEFAGPGRFLADARRLGLMASVDRWVVRETIKQLQPRAQLVAGGAVVLTVNLSGHSLADPQFAGELLAQLKECGVDPCALCFEFAESDVIEHLAAAEPLMHALRDLGCHIALDDFGTGMASLTSLRSLPLTMLKIDGCFVRDLLKDPRAEGMVRGMIHLANSANVATVAEGIETDEIRVRLAAMGVAYGQGFAIARPVPLPEAIRDLPTWVSVSRQRRGHDMELGDEDDTISAALQKQLQRELLAGGIDASVLDEDLETAMQRLIGMDGDDDDRVRGDINIEDFLTEVELSQRKAAG
ncbi:MAG TPA: bifunctional diguanylate cyclase/phosphodiesterase [Steroidobacteraceae bacterium]|nr:bifunctional diguanylate cyclase/phosphodiesterase [Steroidobacteraceae bacterium]